MKKLYSALEYLKSHYVEDPLTYLEQAGLDRRFLSKGIPKALEHSEIDIRSSACDRLYELCCQCNERERQEVDDWTVNEKCTAPSEACAMREACVMLASIALSDPAEHIRAGAVDNLGLMGGLSSFETLVRCLTDESSRVREAACRALGWLRDSRAVEPLISVLDDKYLNVREAACKALGEIRDKRALEPLVAQIHSVDPDVRSSALSALRVLGDVNAIVPVLSTLVYESEIDRAIKAFLHFIGKEEISRYCYELKGSPDSQMTAFAERILERIRS